MSDVNRDPIRWERSMTQNKDGQYVSYHDYAVLLEAHDALRAELAVHVKVSIEQSHEIGKLIADISNLQAQVSERQEPVAYAAVREDGYLLDFGNRKQGMLHNGWNESEIIPLYARPVPAAVPDGCVPVPANVVRFLKGEAAINGLWFGDHNGKPYWWRQYLPTLAAAQDSKP